MMWTFLVVPVLLGFANTQSLTADGESIRSVSSSNTVPQLFQTVPELFAGSMFSST